MIAVGQCYAARVPCKRPAHSAARLLRGVHSRHLRRVHGHYLRLTRVDVDRRSLGT